MQTLSQSGVGLFPTGLAAAYLIITDKPLCVICTAYYDRCVRELDRTYLDETVFSDRYLSMTDMQQTA